MLKISDKAKNTVSLDFTNYLYAQKFLLLDRTTDTFQVNLWREHPIESKNYSQNTFTYNFG